MGIGVNSNMLGTNKQKIHKNKISRLDELIGLFPMSSIFLCNSQGVRTELYGGHHNNNISRHGIASFVAPFV